MAIQTLRKFSDIPEEFRPSYSGAKLPITFFASRGSLMYNTWEEGDDQDYIGVFLPPDDVIFYGKTCEHFSFVKGDMDIVYYSIPKFMNLLHKGNPNAVFPLLGPALQVADSQRFVIRPRDFITDQLFQRTLKFAVAQIEEAKNIEKKFSGFNGEERRKKALAAGYDVKNACSALVLLAMCKEISLAISTHRELSPWRMDRDFYLSIKRGEWKKEDMISFMELELKKVLTLVPPKKDPPTEESMVRLSKSYIGKEMKKWNRFAAFGF